MFLLSPPAMCLLTYVHAMFLCMYHRSRVYVLYIMLLFSEGTGLKYGFLKKGWTNFQPLAIKQCRAMSWKEVGGKREVGWRTVNSLSHGEIMWSSTRGAILLSSFYCFLRQQRRWKIRYALSPSFFQFLLLSIARFPSLFLHPSSVTEW